MRILQVISSGGFYGIESMLLNLATGLQCAGQEVTVGVFQNAGNPNIEVAHRLRDAGISVEIIPCQGRFDWKAQRIVRSLIADRRINVVHPHGYKADFYALAATRGSDVPVVATCHNWLGTSRSLRMYAVIDRWALRRFARVAIISARVGERLVQSGIPSRRIVNIPNGIDPALFTDNRPAEGIRADIRDELVVGFVGRLAQDKGCALLLQAAKQAARKFPAARYVFVGDGPERGAFETLARELGLEQCALFAGRRDDMPRVYAALDICILPSLVEAMPMTILEAMASSKPMIATRVGEIPNMIVDGQTGVLIEPNNVEQLTAALEHLLGDETLRAAMGASGRARACEKYSVEQMTKSYLSVYGEVLPGAQVELKLALEKTTGGKIS